MAKICEIDGCERDQYARGLCRPHYDWKRTHNLLPRRPTAEERFWAKVQKTDGCWLWTARTDKGYGMFWRGDREVRAHRFAYEQLVEPIPAGLELDHRHTCPKHCVNPEHLRPATHQQNSQNLGGAHRDSRSGIRGVSWDAREQKLRAAVCHNGRH